MSIETINSNSKISFLGQPIEEVSCCDSAKKVQEITGKTFGYLTLFYYSLIDFFAPWSDWIKQKQIQELTNLSSLIEAQTSSIEFQTFVDKNFIIGPSNVANIQDAEVILLGKTSDKTQHENNNAKLIDSICDESKDLLLLEYDPIDQSRIKFNDIRDLKHKNLKIDGWDKRDYAREKEFSKLTDKLKKTDVKWFEASYPFFHEITRGLAELDLYNICMYPTLIFTGALSGIIGLWESFNVFSPLFLVIIGTKYSAYAISHFKKTNYDKLASKWKEEKKYFLSQIPDSIRNMCQIIDKNATSARKTFVIADRNLLSTPQVIEPYAKYYLEGYTEMLTSLKKRKFAILLPRTI